MKKTAFCILIVVFALLVFHYGPPGMLPAIADVAIINHMMTKNPQWDTGCATPIPSDTFSPDDKEADCWFAWEGASVGSKITCKWYKPDGELYAEQETLTSYASGCWYSRILISGYAPANIPGEWQAEVYYEGDMKFTEHFTIQGDSPRCPVELLYGDHAEETELLRTLRDTVLSETPEGRGIITLYYQYGPALAEMLDNNEGLKQEARKMVDAFLGRGQ